MGAALTSNRGISDDSFFDPAATGSTLTYDFIDGALWTAIGTESAGADGTAAITLDGVTVAASGGIEITGTASATLGTVAVAASGALTITGTSSATLDTVTVTSSGTLTISGTSAATLDGLAVAGSGTLAGAVTGTSAMTLASLVVAGAGGPAGAVGAVTFSERRLKRRFDDERLRR